MKYGIMGGFIKLAFAKTAFDYIEKRDSGNGYGILSKKRAEGVQGDR